MILKPTQSDKAVIKATGKNWEEWLAILNEDGMAETEHIGINVHLMVKYKLSDWWSAAVATGYERMIGRRQKYQRPDGYFFGSAFKTILGAHYLVWNVIGTPDQWIEPGIIELRTYSNTTLRFDELDRGQVVTFWLADKGDRVGVRATGERFLNVEDALAWKEKWQQRLNDLKELIETSHWELSPYPASE